MKSVLLAEAHRPEDFPDDPRPIVAFAGRSNVGKSSLLNQLIGADGARVSSSPGRTQGIYFYVSKYGWLAADLPGYGYAKASRTSRQAWARLAAAFFESGGPALTARLIDPTIPVTDLDLDFRDYLRGLGLPSLSVATKADRLKTVERAKAAPVLERQFGSILWVSSKTGEGIQTLRKTISSNLTPDVRIKG